MQARAEDWQFFKKGGGVRLMRYLIAWVLGVPGVVIVIWFLMSHH